MRRLTGLLLALSTIQLTSLDVRGECDRHADAAKNAAAVEPAAHGAHAGHTPAPGSGEESSGVTLPKCCMVAGTCSTGAFASIVHVDEVLVGDRDASGTRRLTAPGSASLAPEPPPPKA
jgi:hypothetical protein